MKIQDAKKLAPGDEVYYNDPDDGICSRFYIISKIEIVGGDIIKITSEDGYYLECFAWELS